MDRLASTTVAMKDKARSRILIVDDDPEVRLLLRRCLEREAYEVVEASNGEELFAALGAGGIGLITLDLGLGGEDGLDLARRIRSKHNLPIIMISGKGDTIDRVVGLELGADDYIAKPFHLREVLARVRAVLRRYEAAPPELDQPASSPEKGRRFCFADWTLDTARRDLSSANGAGQELTTAEFNLLEIFVQRPGRVMSRDNLMDLLKGSDWSPVDRTIDNLIARLRKKVEPDPETPRLIKTVRGVGYVFTAEVERG
jgi:two-component system OmpR family response regulator